MLIVGNLFGPRKTTPVKRMPYESGMDPIHDTRRRFDVRFYLLAIAFLVFDVELLFLYPWAVVFGAKGTTGDAAAEMISARPPLIFVGGMVFLLLLVLLEVFTSVPRKSSMVKSFLPLVILPSRTALEPR